MSSSVFILPLTWEKIFYNFSDDNHVYLFVFEPKQEVGLGFFFFLPYKNLRQHHWWGLNKSSKR